MAKLKHNHWNRFFLTTLIVVLGISLFFIGLYFLIEITGCKSQEFPKVISLDGKHEAQVKIHDCGATTPFSAWAELRDNNGKKAKVFSLIGAPIDIELKWLTNKKLQISYSTCDLYGDPRRYPVEPGKKSWNDVELTYVDKCAK